MAKCLVRNLAGEVVLETPLPDSLEDLRGKASSACGVPPGVLRFVKDQEALTTLEDLGAPCELVLMVDETPCFSWDLAGNPDHHFLKGSGATVEFSGSLMADPDYINVLTQVPIERGVHFVEFVMHSLQDEQWCGVTFSPKRAGRSGGDLPGCYYYSGRRYSAKGNLDATRERQHRMTFQHVNSGDVIGLMLDANRGAALFSLNGVFQGGARLPTRPMQQGLELYLCTALDRPDDRVELRRRSPDEFPVQLEEVMDTPLFLKEDLFEALNWQALESQQIPRAPWDDASEPPESDTDLEAD